MSFYPRFSRPYAGKILLQMKLTVGLMLLASLHLYAGAGAQKISLNVRNSPLEQVFQQIGRQAPFLFVYDLEAVKKAPPVTFSVKEATIQQAMDRCLADLPFAYTIVNNTVVLKPRKEKEKEAEVSVELLVPPITVTGTIINEAGIPQAGVSILVKGTSKGTVTNDRGEFSLSGVEDNAVLVISGVNIETRELGLNGRSQLSVSVKTVVQPLEETIVKGYYTTTKELIQVLYPVSPAIP